MKTKEYNIKIHSISRFIIALITILLSSVMLILDNLPLPKNKIISIIQFLSVFISSIYFAHLIGMAKVKILFTEEGIVHIWKSRFIFSWTKNFKIPWSIVDNYVFQEDRTFDSFIINLTNKTRYKINRLNILPINDDFNSLVRNFQKLSNEYKSNLTTNIKMVKEGESFYESRSFKWLFYLMFIGFLILVLTNIFNHDSKTTWSSLGIIGSSLIFYGSIIIRKKKSN